MSLKRTHNSCHNINDYECELVFPESVSAAKRKLTMLTHHLRSKVDATTERNGKRTKIDISSNTNLVDTATY